MPSGIIYKVTNILNKKIYIGQTVNGLKKRKRGHISDAKYSSYNSYFHKAIKKYGEDNFNWEIIEYCDSKEELNEMEFHYIKQFGSYINGYNLTLGGEGSPGVVRSEKVRKKISKALSGKNSYWYGKHHSYETKQKISKALKGENNPNYGKPRPFYVVEKVANSNKGKKRTDAQRCRMSKAKLGKYIGADNSNAKKYVITTPEKEEFVVCGLTNFCRLFKPTKLNFKNLSQCATGEKKRHKGYLCRYYDENTDFTISKWEKLKNVP